MTTTRTLEPPRGPTGVDPADWDGVGAELDAYGCALIGPLLTADVAADIAGLYGDDARFRSTVKFSG